MHLLQDNLCFAQLTSQIRNKLGQQAFVHALGVDRDLQQAERSQFQKPVFYPVGVDVEGMSAAPHDAAADLQSQSGKTRTVSLAARPLLRAAELIAQIKPALRVTGTGDADGQHIQDDGPHASPLPWTQSPQEQVAVQQTGAVPLGEVKDVVLERDKARLTVYLAVDKEQIHGQLMATLQLEIVWMLVWCHATQQVDIYRESNLKRQMKEVRLLLSFLVRLCAVMLALLKGQLHAGKIIRAVVQG